MKAGPYMCDSPLFYSTQEVVKICLLTDYVVSVTYLLYQVLSWLAHILCPLLQSTLTQPQIAGSQMSLLEVFLRLVHLLGR